MKKLRLGLLQANFRSSFPEKIPAIARVARGRKTMERADYEFNHGLLGALATKARDRGAELVVSPESYPDGWSCSAAAIQETAETIPGPRTNELCLLAKKLRIWMCVAFMGRTSRAIYNTAILVSARGEIVGLYRKTHETKDVLARGMYKLGDDLPVFGTPWGRVGILICHDRWYPEAARTLRLKGAELIVNPTATAIFNPRHAYHEIHRCTQRSSAYLNGFYWASCNSANHGGHSVVIGPDGNLLAEARSTQQVKIVEIKPNGHKPYDFISNLRPRLYSFGRTTIGRF